MRNKMIKVNKTYGSPPGVLTKKGCYDKIKRAVNATNGSDKIYNGNHYKEEQVTTQLNIIYNKKCAYCESFSAHVAPLQVEHYRPKAKVIDLTSPNPNGYYWLGCEWSNLLLACSKCNGSNAKGNNFPILGNRILNDSPFNHLGHFNRTHLIADRSPLIDEQPLLLNPEIDYPEQHLHFRYFGKISGLTKKGHISINIYKLNRNPLFKRRQEIVNGYVSQLKRILFRYEAEYYTSEGFENILKDFFRDIKSINISKQEYILWRQYISNNFSKCILQRVPLIYRHDIGKVFILYKQGKL